MTFRRVMLVVLPLLAVVFVFMVLRYLYSTWLESLEGPGPEIPSEALREPSGAGAEQETGRGTAHEISTNVYLERKDRLGRTEMIFVSPRIVHRAKDTCDVTRPRIQFFTRSDEVITLSADYATALTDGPLTDIANIRSGRLWGNVVLVHDRGTHENLTDDLLVGMDDLVFDNETYEMSTEGAVVMASQDVDLTAKRMRILLDRQTRRINTMTFYEDILILLEAGDRLQMGLGRRAGTKAAPTSAEPPNPPSAASPTPEAPPGPGAPSAAPRPETAAPTPETPAAEEPESSGGDLWRIDLGGNVDARQLASRLLCDQLTLYNETARSALEPGAPDSSAEGASLTARRSTPGDESRRSREESPGPPVAESETGAAAAAATPPPAPSPASGDPEYLQPEAPPPLVVIADGPLIITPVPDAERKELAGAENEVIAVGEPATVEDGETRVVGREIHYNLKTGGGLVVGTPGRRILEQPGRMWLTGDRLTFDRTRGTADVAGEGKLHALVATESLTGTAAADSSAVALAKAEGLKPEPSALDARWARGMHLEFYELPEGAAGTGELRRAAFSGQAEVVQKDGLLRGDELAIDFFPAEEERGQAVERLMGHGDVFVKNTRPGAAVAGAENVGDIACQDLDMRFARGAGGGSEPQRLNAAGKVLIHDAKGAIRAENLVVTFARDEKGELEAEFLDATGNVLIDRTDLRAEGDHVKRDLAGGVLILEGTQEKPAGATRIRMVPTEVPLPPLPPGAVGATVLRWAVEPGEKVERGAVLLSAATGRGAIEVRAPADGVLKSRERAVGDKVAPGDVVAVLDCPSVSRIVGPYVEFLEKEGKATVRGAGELEVPATTDLRGQALSSAEPLVIRWGKRMVFEDARNFAFFDADVKAETGDDSRLDTVACRRLWVYFCDKPSAAGGAEKSKEKPTGELGGLLGSKDIERVFAEEDVLAAERRMDDDGCIRYHMEIAGTNLTYLAENRKAYMRGPGRMRILARERPESGETPPPGLRPEDEGRFWAESAPTGYSRTHIAWTEGMAYDGPTDRAYFKGGVESIHIGRGVPGEAGAPRRETTTTKIRSADLQVAFSESPPAGTSAAPREERMGVEKMVADGGVQLWVDDRRGSGQRLMYQRKPELLRLYSGLDQWARLWQANEALQKHGEVVQEFGEVAARVITYYPDTKRVDMVDQQELVVTPR